MMMMMTIITIIIMNGDDVDVNNNNKFLRLSVLQPFHPYLHPPSTLANPCHETSVLWYGNYRKGESPVFPPISLSLSLSPSSLSLSPFPPPLFVSVSLSLSPSPPPPPPPPTLSLSARDHPVSRTLQTAVQFGCFTSQQHASVSQRRICSDKFTCCHTET